MKAHDHERRKFLKAAGLGAGALAVPGCLNGVAPVIRAAERRKPNFVVIFCDDLGYGDIGCFGSGGPRTKGLDAPTAEGVPCALTDRLWNRQDRNLARCRLSASAQAGRSGAP